MISLLLEKKRKKAQHTVLGIDYDKYSLAAVKLKKQNDKYSLVCCSSEVFSEEAYFEGELIAEYVGGLVANIIKEYKLGYFVKLGFAFDSEIDVEQERIFCDKRALSVIEKEGIHFFIRENFLKKRFPDNYTFVAYDYDDEELAEKQTLLIYYIPNVDKFKQLHTIADKSKKALSVCTLDTLAISNFVNELFLSEISQNSSDSVFMGLYSDKISLYSFSPQGELKTYETLKIFDENITDDNYISESLQFLLRFIDFISLDFNVDNLDSFSQNYNHNVYIYGIKQNFESIFASIKELSQVQCKKLDPFININVGEYGKIEQPYRYVLPVAIAMKEAL
ncbi:MAG: hypothetical protein Kow0076_8170 [Francisella sp.]